MEFYRCGIVAIICKNLASNFVNNDYSTYGCLWDAFVG